MDLEFVEVILVLYSLEFSVYHLSKVFPGRIKATKPAKTAMTLTNPAVIVQGVFYTGPALKCLSMENQG